MCDAAIAGAATCRSATSYYGQFPTPAISFEDRHTRVDHVPVPCSSTTTRAHCQRLGQETYLAQVDILSDLVFNALHYTPIILDTITLLEPKSLEADTNEEIAPQHVVLITVSPHVQGVSMRLTLALYHCSNKSAISSLLMPS